MHSKKVIAAFDFDGTITYRDSFLPFLCYVKGAYSAYVNTMCQLPQYILYASGLRTRQQIKESLLISTLANMPIELAQQYGNAFALHRIPKLIKPKALNRLNWHLTQGHQCVLVSANLDLYLEPWAKNIGFHHCLTSVCETVQGKLTGRLKGQNCRGPEKTKRLIELFGNRDKYLLYAYGDSTGDKEMLSMADYPFYKQFR